MLSAFLMVISVMLGIKALLKGASEVLMMEGQVLHFKLFHPILS